MLSFEEGRVLGVLIEKLLTTPDQMPLSVNGCMLGCNQKSNRSPVVNMSEPDVRLVLEQLQSKGFALHCSGAGSRVEKFTQSVDKALDLSREDICIMSILLLRGAQTPGELSTRSKRAWPDSSLLAIETLLNTLSTREPPLVKRLERQPGQKESRWLQLLNEDSDTQEEASLFNDEGNSEPRPQKDDELQSLKEEVVFLRDEVNELRELVEELMNRGSV